MNPCPKCNAIGAIIVPDPHPFRTTFDWCHVECTACGFKGPRGGAEVQAVSLWDHYDLLQVIQNRSDD